MISHRSHLSLGGLVVAAASLLFPTLSRAQDGSVNPDAGAAELNAAIDGYVAAYNEGQIDQVMSFWAENADFVDIRGQFHEGRDLISALFRRGFAENPGRSIELNSASRKFLSPNVAMDDGILELTSPDGMKSSGRYTVVWTKADGKWLIRSARDIPIEVEPSEEDETSPMEQLDWMVGQWKAESDEHELTMSCKWELDNRYLVQLFDVKSEEEVFRVINFVGFDPSEGRFRSWFFDSRGGFGGGPWTRVDDQYQVSNLAVLPDGRLGSSVMKWRQTDPDTVTFQATERVVGSQALPDSEQIYKRVK
jgi:uncharacterized protein (TIGR02246 family)